MQNYNKFSRKEIFKVSAIGFGGLNLARFNNKNKFQQFAAGDKLARVTEPKLHIRAKPHIEGNVVGTLVEDDVIPWLREVVGYNPYRFSQRWVETPDGYIWSPLLQPVENNPAETFGSLVATSNGPGMWVQVSIPYVDVTLEKTTTYSPSISNRVSEGKLPRLYYSQVIWADDIRQDDSGIVWYRLNEKYGYGDIFWGPATAFQVLTPEEIAPISPEAENKRIDINLFKQTLSCFENDREVYFCRVSTGQIGSDTETPLGNNFFIWRKMVSSHMSGGTTGGGWDLPGVGFTSLFIGGGIAIHSTFWHNNYGEKTSRGCVNVRPDDAKWIFRWTSPQVGFDPGDITVSDFSGTIIRVLEI
jgi:hypothetical protein